jgi:hypothetical protein
MGALGGIALLGLAPLGAGASSDQTAAVTKTVSFAVNLRVEIPGHYAVSWKADGQANFLHHAAQEFVTLPTIGLHANGILPGHKPVQMVAKWVGDKAYVTVPSSVSKMPGTPKSLSVPVGAARAHEIDLALDQSAVALTYTKVLLNDLADPKAQHAVDPRTIGGVRVTGTRVALTLADLLKVSPGLSPTMIGDLSMFGNESIPVTLWIDHEGRLVEATMGGDTKAHQASVSGVIEFSHYNDAVTITAPAAQSVAAMPASVSQLLSGLQLFDIIPLP